MKVVWPVVWVLASGVILFPIGYFALHWGDPAFRDNAVGNWFGTIVGVTVGVPIALQLTRTQQRAQEKAERDRQQKNRQDQIIALEGKMREELAHNLNTVERLREVLHKSPQARNDLWEWAEKVVRSVEFLAWGSYASFIAADNSQGETAEYIAYRSLKRLSAALRKRSRRTTFLWLLCKRSRGQRATSRGPEHGRKYIEQR